MTQDEIMKMAIKAKLTSGGDPRYPSSNNMIAQRLKEFADLIIESEREACAKVCETHIVDDILMGVEIAQSCATVIRARGQE